MSHVLKRSISRCTWAASHFYSKSPPTRAYIEERLKAFCADHGLDTQGAEIAEITSTGHSGGTQPSEPFHIVFRAQTKDGKLFTTVNPHTKKPTHSWHCYIAKDKADLNARALAYYNGTNASK
ncbi:hypothetical protein BC834DRAFT_843463 [Gloeopeniophorella convolvens]|nr:hypothetical protein BC834DRAFT_843463 [Gloeopeniophorella convolvens]